MKQPEDTRTLELPGLEVTQRPATSLAALLARRDSLERSARQIGKARGPYAGRYDKPETAAFKVRASTGLTMAEFAARAGVSERTLRNWEAGVGKPSTATLVAISDALRAAKCDGDAFARAFPGQATKPAKRVAYRNAMTGETWSGRGLMPRWLRVRLDDGARLQDFAA